MTTSAQGDARVGEVGVGLAQRNLGGEGVALGLGDLQKNAGAGLVALVGLLEGGAAGVTLAARRAGAGQRG